MSNAGSELNIATKVFGITELLEHILLYLTPRQILATRRVSSDFNRVVLDSSPLRPRLFTNPNVAFTLQGKHYGKRRAGSRRFWQALRINDITLKRSDQVPSSMIHSRERAVMHRPEGKMWTYRLAQALRSSTAHHLLSHAGPRILPDDVAVSFRTRSVRPTICIPMTSGLVDKAGMMVEHVQVLMKDLCITQPPIPTDVVVLAKDGPRTGSRWRMAAVAVGPATIGQIVGVALLLWEGVERCSSTSDEDCHYLPGCSSRWSKDAMKKFRNCGSPNDRQLAKLMLSRPAYQ